MALRLSIDNETSLPDGGPLSITVTGKRGIDIGRDRHLDWTLPDPSRTISGKHCEIRFRDDGYWLHDISTNGTYLNGSDRRLQGPHRLRNGDRFAIGHYVILVTLNEDAETSQPVRETLKPVSFDPPDFWAPSDDSAPPLPRRDLEPARETRPLHSDFFSQPLVPPPLADWSSAPEPAPEFGKGDMAWMMPKDSVPLEPDSPVPRPRTHQADWTQPLTRKHREDPSQSEDFTIVPAPQAVKPENAAPVEPPSVAPRREQAEPPLSGGPAADDMDFVRSFAKGAELPVEVIAWRDPNEFAELLGSLMRLIATDLKKLLAARAETKRIARSTNQTMVQAVQNNPLKFSPTPEDALRLMFGRPTSGYFDARRTFEESFKDLSVHQVKTYAAMQGALRLLIEDLDPQAIEEALSSDRGIWKMMGSRKARLWDAYVVSWHAKTAPYEHGIVDAFMHHFAECYDRSGTPRQE
ncbi:type VI secretion system-associated FHA domain protein TagH [Microvirga pakistanensis]|uniref:type VI secretion system-associated FHA domain protein TagH n=1 Tax=Microvirga pakistanensis TaxID=1682650 RepID=UPI001FCEA11C|nr:type VI secretion system-associated FHA domain protein TagH [Microvirga pakistanensis]